LELPGVQGDSVRPKDLKKCLKLINNWNLGLDLHRGGVDIAETTHFWFLSGKRFNVQYLQSL